MDSVVLLLNSDYEPLNVCNVRRAFRLVFGEKAEVIQYDHHEVRTPTQIFRAPSVIRLQHRISRPRPRVKLTRREKADLYLQVALDPMGQQMSEILMRREKANKLAPPAIPRDWWEWELDNWAKQQAGQLLVEGKES